MQPSTAPPLAWSRRQWLALCLGAGMGGASGQAGAAGLAVRPLVFPRDHGSHPELRTEWWYLTGQARAGGRDLGFQLTFFRSRVPGTQAMQSAFAARQLLFAHAALSDTQNQRLLHDQRIARAGFGLAQASDADTDIVLGDWSLRRSEVAGSSRYAARMQGDTFSLDLTLSAT
ncbi:MAG: carotenoid 1,2-hydratase, partial [Giesbergeria sp.]|nr:carotenoid 1,2-hydratase [Giesbergeria sp.]